MKKYLVIPDHIIEKQGVTYVSANELIRLYGVNPEQCYIELGDSFRKNFDTKHLIELRPRVNGDYKEWLKSKTNIDAALAKIKNPDRSQG